MNAAAQVSDAERGVLVRRWPLRDPHLDHRQASGDNDYRFTAGDIVGEGRGSHTQAGVFTSRYSLNYDLPQPGLWAGQHMVFSFLDDFMLGVDEQPHAQPVPHDEVWDCGSGDITLWIERRDVKRASAWPPMVMPARFAPRTPGGRVGRKN